MARRRGVGASAILSLIGIAVLVIFMIQNTEQVRVHFLGWYFTWSVWVLTLVTAVIGALAWFGIGVVRRYQRGR